MYQKRASQFKPVVIKENKLNSNFQKEINANLKSVSSCLGQIKKGGEDKSYLISLYFVCVKGVVRFWYNNFY